jgi:5'-methylthioadenosine phosphorylase
LERPLAIGVIGGGPLPVQWSKPFEKLHLTTRYGDPSAFIAKTTLDSGSCVYSLLRHGEKHSAGSEINNLANVESMHVLGCDVVVSLNLIGSLTGRHRLGETVIYDDIIDFRKVSTSFYTKSEGVHVAMAPLVSPALATQLTTIAHHLEVSFGGNMMVPEGPRYPTVAESNMFVTLGAQLICQTVAPEAFLIRERGMEWFGCGLITDFHVHDPTQPLTTRLIYENMKPFEAAYARTVLQILERLRPFERSPVMGEAAVPTDLITNF